MFDYRDALLIIGSLVRLLGMLVFGAAAGWFTLYAFRQAGQRWQLQIAVFLGFFFFIALVVDSTSPSGIGGLALGAGAALLFWGLKDGKKPKEDDEAEEE
jgi:hypothetical protein